MLQICNSIPSHLSVRRGGGRYRKLPNVIGLTSPAQPAPAYTEFYINEHNGVKRCPGGQDTPSHDLPPPYNTLVDKTCIHFSWLSLLTEEALKTLQDKNTR